MRTIAEIFRSYAVFDADGRHVNGTDKQSNHNYGDAYDSLFSPTGFDDNLAPVTTREEVELVLEVGVADGSCLLAWREVFPNATVVGMDIHPAAKLDSLAGLSLLNDKPIEFHLGDQRNSYDCMKAVNARLFDLIIDDATHNIEDTLRTLLYLWPSVRLGGLYVIEEPPGLFWPNIKALCPYADRIDTAGPFGGVEPLVFFRKPM